MEGLGVSKFSCHFPTHLFSEFFVLTDIQLIRNPLNIISNVVIPAWNSALFYRQINIIDVNRVIFNLSRLNVFTLSLDKSISSRLTFTLCVAIFLWIKTSKVEWFPVSKIRRHGPFSRTKRP